MRVEIARQALSGANTATLSFTAPSASESSVRTFRLTVTDNDNATVADEVTVTVQAVPPSPPSSGGGDTGGGSGGGNVAPSLVWLLGLLVLTQVARRRRRVALLS